MMHRRFLTIATSPFAAIALAALLSGCGRDDEAPPPPTVPEPVAADTAAVAPGDEALANAVVTSKTAAAVDLKYDVLAKPAVGQPFEIELTFLPRLAADVLEIEVTGIPGLELVSGGSARIEAVNAGDRHSTRVLVRADAAGLYYVGVVAKMMTQVQSDVRTFSVPVVVGEVAAAEKAAPGTDATGQAIESMPASESTTKPVDGQ
jgi:hypothetical protein